VELVFTVMEYIGIVAFTVSGAMVSIHKEADLFGVVLLSVMTAFGGGIIRDICLGITPPSFFSLATLPKVGVSIFTALAVFFIAMIFKRSYVKSEAKIDAINNVFDALGLGIFAVHGTEIAIVSGNSAPLVAILMGLLTGIGGGMFRDLSLSTVPFIIRKRVYAVATITGASVYYVLIEVLKLGSFPSMLLGILTTFILRICATVFKWNMPKAIRFSEFEN